MHTYYYIGNETRYFFETIVKERIVAKDWRSTREYRAWRAEVIRRDKVCVICNDRTSRQAHHINHATYFQEQRFDASNGVCLCSSCHIQFHTNFKTSFKEKCTRYDFDNFVVISSYMMEKGREAYKTRIIGFITT